MIRKAAVRSMAYSCIAAYACLAFASTAQAQNAGGVTGPELLNIVRQIDPDAELQQDSIGDPMIIASAPAQDFVIITQDCDEGRCGVIRMIASWKGPYGAEAIADVNVYHASQLFGRGFLDAETDINLEWNLITIGASSDYLVHHVDIWASEVIRVFQESVVFRGRPTPAGGAALNSQRVKLTKDALAKKVRRGVYKSSHHGTEDKSLTDVKKAR